jgi:hypothetical protein
MVIYNKSEITNKLCLPKKVGRPRKLSIDDASNKLDGPIKLVSVPKKVGRPRKLSIDDVSNNASNNIVIVRKKVGRPRKLSIIDNIVNNLNKLNISNKIIKSRNFIPTIEDLKNLPKYKKNITRRRFLALYNKEYFYKKLNDNNNNIYENQYERAYTLLQSCLDNDFTKASLVDGHGRMIYQILYLTHNIDKFKKLKNIKLYVCEIDSTCHKYHKQFLPNNVYKIKMNIFDFYNKFYYDKKCIFYYNFTSLGKSYNYIIENIIRIINNNHIIMITFHVRRANYLYNFANLLNNINSYHSNRGNTHSWLIPKQNNKYIKLKDYIYKNLD